MYISIHSTASIIIKHAICVGRPSNRGAFDGRRSNTKGVPTSTLCPLLFSPFSFFFRAPLLFAHSRVHKIIEPKIYFTICMSVAFSKHSTRIAHVQKKKKEEHRPIQMFLFCPVSSAPFVWMEKACILGVIFCCCCSSIYSFALQMMEHDFV